MEFTIEIAQESDEWDAHADVNQSLFSKITADILSRYPNFAKIEQIELSILLTDNAKISELNKEFRGKNKPTNVLSFPDMQINWREIVEFPVDNEYMYLGDIAFGYQIIADEALDKHISFEDHFKHLLIHAILHLIGYDHVEEEDAKAMENLEIDILHHFGISSPY